MSLVEILNVEVLDNPTKLTNPFQFQITFECRAPGIKEGELLFPAVCVVVLFTAVCVICASLTSSLLCTRVKIIF